MRQQITENVPVGYSLCVPVSVYKYTEVYINTIYIGIY